MFDQNLRTSLRQTYARSVEYRDALPLQDWKARERCAFLELLQTAGADALLEIGAGPGRDSAYFAKHGLNVVATDITPENADACRQKGLTALVLDACAIPLPPDCFDAVYTFNCLLHLPKHEFPLALSEVARILKPDGLFYLGQYGGPDREAVWEDDPYRPPRLFSFFSDENLFAAVAPLFDIQTFKHVPLQDDPSALHFQALLLRKSGPSAP